MGPLVWALGGRAALARLQSCSRRMSTSVVGVSGEGDLLGLAGGPLGSGARREVGLGGLVDRGCDLAQAECPGAGRS